MRRATTLLTAFVATALLAACGDSDGGDTGLGPDPSLSVDQIAVDVDRDVTQNLALHFEGASKPPVGAVENRVDFRETSRSESGGEGIVSGNFIFYTRLNQVHRGHITIHYRRGVETWLRTGRFEVFDNEPVDSRVVSIHVSDASTGRPLSGAEVELVRVDELRTAVARLTDIEGAARLEVLPGVFRAHVTRDNYETLVTEPISALDDVEVAGLRMEPLKKGLYRP